MQPAYYEDFTEIKNKIKNIFFIIIIFINILNNSTLKKPKIGFLLFKI